MSDLSKALASAKNALDIEAAALNNLAADIEANIKADFNQQLWMGFGYRHKESYSAMFGVQLRHNMHMSYSYDLNANGLANQSMGSHELVLGITINNKIGVPTPH